MTRRRRAIWLCVVSLAVYLANGRLIPTDDSIPARYLPVSVLRHGTLTLDPFPALAMAERPYYVTHAGGHLLSNYPVGAALMAMPFFADAVVLADDPTDAWLRAREKLAAAAIVALSVALLFAAMTHLTDTRTATVLALIYAFGSSSLSQSSQALWQHGPAQLCIALALLALVRLRERMSWALVAGVALGCCVVVRPATALIAVPLATAVVAQRPRSVGWLVAGAALPAAFMLWYSVHYFGAPLRLQFDVASDGAWPTPLGDGLAGVLFSPGRGLFVYSPVFLLSIVGAARGWNGPHRVLMRASTVAAAAIVLLTAKWNIWWGGACYGPRLLADITPLLTLLLVPAAAWVRAARWRVVAAGGLVLWSVGAHAVGAFCGNISWNTRRDIDAHPERLWSWIDNQPCECLRVLAGRGTIE